MSRPATDLIIEHRTKARVRAAMRYAAVLALALVALAGCGGATKTVTATPTTPTQPKAPVPTTPTKAGEGPGAGAEPPATREEIENEIRTAHELLARKIAPEQRRNIESELRRLEEEKPSSR
jgi:hypothetical protein